VRKKVSNYLDTVLIQLRNSGRRVSVDTENKDRYLTARNKFKLTLHCRLTSCESVDNIDYSSALVGVPPWRSVARLQAGGSLVTFVNGWAEVNIREADRSLSRRVILP